ncbi:beta-glucosidase [Leptolinea sp. HRD-7]|nr:beta-glucosidase [Leptolinea sp. HRD-7]
MEYPKFPPGFVFGAASSAYQIEGAVNVDGRGPSVWDTFSHTKGKIRNSDNGDIACDHYNRMAEDVALMKSLGLKAYRFSIAWPRIYPDGEGQVNQKGLDFYSRLTDLLLKNDITPFPTLFHWDLPQALQTRYNGFENRAVSSLFADYTETVVRALGDRVVNWTTLNEPFEFAALGHFLGQHAPGKTSLPAYFRVMHHLLLGHGMAVERIRAVAPQCKMGIVVSLTPIHPQTDTDKDRQAAMLANQFLNHITLSPIYKGSYPEPLWGRTRLLHPAVKEGDMSLISQPIDFLGINNYQREFATFRWYVPFLQMDISGSDIADTEFVRDGVQHTSMGWEVYPQGIYECLRLLKDEYNNPPVYITENGAAFDDRPLEDGTVNDPLRVQFLDSYIRKAHQALEEGCDLRGYFVWSLMDNFEWAAGYSKRFGIVYVDYATQKRTVKESGRWYKGLIHAQSR